MLDESMQEFGMPETDAGQVNTDTEIVEGFGATEAEPVTYTIEQVEAEKAKIQSTFEKQRKAAERERDNEKQINVELRQRLADFEKQQQAWEEERIRREEEELSGLPEGDKLVAWRRRLTEKEESLKKEKADARQKYNDGLIGLKIGHAHKLAKEYGVDDWELLMDANSENDMKVKAMELKIKKLEGKTTTETATKKNEDEDITPAHIDSSVSSKGHPRRLFSLREIENMDIETFKKYEDQITRQLGEGRFREK